MSQVEVEISKVKEPAGLATIQTLGGTEEGKVFMICENLDGKGRSMEVMMPGFESTDCYDHPFLFFLSLVFLCFPFVSPPAECLIPTSRNSFYSISSLYLRS